MENLRKLESTAAGRGGLPAELLASSVRRLGWVALIYAAFFIILNGLYRSYYGEQHTAVYDVLLAGAVGLGLGMFGLVRWSGWPAARLLHVGLAFQVAGGLLIAAGEHARPWPVELRGYSALCIWLPIFALLVPAARGPAAAASFLTAAMSPLGLGLNIWLRGVPPPAPAQLPMLLTPVFLVAGAAVFLSRTLYQLGLTVARERQMGSYQLLEPLGAGGMGEVWRAKHRLLAREAAIKIIHPAGPSAAAAPVVRQRFEREARAIAALESPHTITLFDYGLTERQQLYYVMELVRGLDLEELVRRTGPVAPERAAYLLAQVCASLEEAHRAGLTHRDIKPRNIIAGQLGAEADFVKVLDFGLVKTLADGEETQLTQQNATTGTPAYMAPEMALGQPVDGRTDLYSLGCVGYWLLTGQTVFPAKAVTAVLMDHVRTRPVPPSERVETAVPAALEGLILGCLEKEPGARPASAGELRRALEPLAAGWDRERAREWWRTHAPGRPIG